GGSPFQTCRRDRARATQARDGLGVEAQLVENLLGVLADLRRAPRSHFRLLVQVHRTVDRQARLPTAIVNGHQYVVGNELWVACDFVEGLRDTVGEIGGRKELTPLF